MTKKQLKKIKVFSKSFFGDDKYHGWDHVLRVKDNAEKLMVGFDVDEMVVVAGCYLHDVGRSVKDKGHSEESVNLGAPFLAEIGVEKEAQNILEVVRCHSKSKIAETDLLEARLVYDADKLEMLTGYGFLRVVGFCVDEYGMEMGEAIDAWLELFEKGNAASLLFTKRAKEMVENEKPMVLKMIKLLRNRGFVFGGLVENIN